VHDYQLSLAIGKEGQNARLAARLTGWRIDIKSETQLAEEESGGPEGWAEGEWVESETGEMVFQPAGGGASISLEEWQGGAADDADTVASEGTEPVESDVVDAPTTVDAAAEASIASGPVAVVEEEPAP
jgi:N utilization substance protein A